MSRPSFEELAAAFGALWRAEMFLAASLRQFKQWGPPSREWLQLEEMGLAKATAGSSLSGIWRVYELTEEGAAVLEDLETFAALRDFER